MLATLTMVLGVLLGPWLGSAFAAGDTLAGMVRDGSGRALSGVTVRIWDTSCTGLVDTLTTDTDGEWGVFLELGSYKLEYSGTGYAPELYDDVVTCAGARAVAPEPVDRDAVLTAGATVSGALRTSAGTVPAGRHTVVATTDRAAAYAQTSTTTGSYSLPSLHAGTYTITVRDAANAKVGQRSVTVGTSATTADVTVTSAAAPTPAPTTPAPTTPAPTTPAPTTPAPTTPAPTTPAPTTSAPTTPAPTTPAPTTPAPTTPAPTTPAPTTPAPTTPAPTTPAPTTPAPTTPAPTTPAPTTPAPTTPAPTTPAPTTPAPTTPAPTTPAPTTPAPTTPAPTTPAPTTPAPATGTISVSVVDAGDRRPVAGIAVVVDAGARTATSASGADGRSVLGLLPTGQATVRLSDAVRARPGGTYPSTAVLVTVDPGSTTHVVAVLNRIVAVSPPTWSGRAAVGSSLTASPGTWRGADLSVDYQWLRDGRSIPGADARAYRPTAADAGHRLAVRVIASAPDAVTRTATSGATAPVAARTAARVTIVRGNRRSAVLAVTVRDETARAADGVVRVQVGGRMLARSVTVDGGTGTFRLTRRSLDRGLVLRFSDPAGRWLPSAVTVPRR